MTAHIPQYDPFYCRSLSIEVAWQCADYINYPRPHIYSNIVYLVSGGPFSLVVRNCNSTKCTYMISLPDKMTHERRREVYLKNCQLRLLVKSNNKILARPTVYDLFFSVISTYYIVIVILTLDNDLLYII